VFKKFAAAGAMAAVMGGVILGSSPAQADSNDGSGSFCSSPCSGSFCSPHCKPGHWHWGWHSGNGNGSGNSTNQLIPIQLCDILNHLINITVLAKSDNQEKPICINGPVAGNRVHR
jgi:hypothetical protein